MSEAITANSGRDRTTAWAYAVGWTQHSTGVQCIRTASILQTLLGNIGRPGGGILALRGHASIQGSTDVPTLFDLLPGYLPMPTAHHEQTLASYCAADAGQTGFWGNISSYAVSLLKSWWADAATAENDFRFDWLPRIDGDHNNYQSVLNMIDGEVRGYVVAGENPAVGGANGRLQRQGLANLEWLVVRDFTCIETATFWKNSPEIEAGERRTEDIGTEVFFLPAAAHVEKDGSFTNTQRLLQWHGKAVEPPADARSELWFFYHLGRRIREKLAGSTDLRDQPILELTWDYGAQGPDGEPNAEAVLAEINGTGPDGRPLQAHTELRDDGSTRCGCWIYCGVYADGVNQAARRRPAARADLGRTGVGLGVARQSPDAVQPGVSGSGRRPWSERKAYIRWDADAGRWTGPDVPDFEVDKAPDYLPPAGATAQDALAGDDPFIMQVDGKAWLFAPAGVVDGPLPAHYEPVESPHRNLLYPDQPSNPATITYDRPGNRYHPAESEVFPFVLTAYRLTEHQTGGGMTRHLPYLAELQPEAFCGVSPELARQRGLTHLGWATVITARSAIELKVLVTDRMKPLQVDGRVSHQIGVPWHFGPNAGHRRQRQRPAAHGAGPQRASRSPRCSAATSVPGGARAGPRCVTWLPATGGERGSPNDHGPGPAKDGIFHRYLGVHRLHGLRGGVQGVEPGAGRRRSDGQRSGHRRRYRGDGPVRHVRQHRCAGRQHLAPRRVHRGCAARAGAWARRCAVADVLRRVQALHPRGMPGRVPDRVTGSVPSWALW